MELLIVVGLFVMTYGYLEHLYALTITKKHRYRRFIWTGFVIASGVDIVYSNWSNRLLEAVVLFLVGLVCLEVTRVSTRLIDKYTNFEGRFISAYVEEHHIFRRFYVIPDETEIARRAMKEVLQYQGYPYPNAWYMDFTSSQKAEDLKYAIDCRARELVKENKG